MTIDELIERMDGDAMLATYELLRMIRSLEQRIEALEQKKSFVNAVSTKHLPDNTTLSI